MSSFFEDFRDGDRAYRKTSRSNRCPRPAMVLREGGRLRRRIRGLPWAEIRCFVRPGRWAVRRGDVLEPLALRGTSPGHAVCGGSRRALRPTRTGSVLGAPVVLPGWPRDAAVLAQEEQESGNARGHHIREPGRIRSSA